MKKKQENTHLSWKQFFPCLTNVHKKAHEYFEKNIKDIKENTSILNDNWFDLSDELGLGWMVLFFMPPNFSSVSFLWPKKVCHKMFQTKM